MQTKLYRIVTDDRECILGTGFRKWSLPNIRCPKCPFDGGPLWAYPVVNLEGLEIACRFSNSTAVSVEEFGELAKTVRPYIPKHLPVQRCTGLGRFHGKVVGMFPGVAHAPCYGTLLIADSTYELLRSKGLETLQGVPAEIYSKREPRLRFVELQVDSLLQLAVTSHPHGGLRTCPLCGRNNIKQLHIESIAVRMSSIPECGDVFALLEFPSPPIVTARFKSLVEAMRLPGLTFHEVRVINE